MANVVGTKISDDGTPYWIFFEHGNIERPLLMLHDVVLKCILEDEGYELVRKKASEKDVLQKLKESPVMAVVMPDKIDFTVTRTENNEFLLSYSEYFNNLPEEFEERFDSIVDTTISLMEQKGVKVTRLERGLHFEPRPLPCEEVITAIVGEIAGMSQGVISVGKIEKLILTVKNALEELE